MSFMDPDQRQTWAEQAQKQRDRHGRQCGWNGANCPDREEHTRLYGGPVPTPKPTVSSPGEIAARRTAALAPDIERLICAIEAELLVRDGDAWVATKGFRPGAITAVLEKYRAAGWNVEHVSDGRDGDSLVLKP